MNLFTYILSAVVSAAAVAGILTLIVGLVIRRQSKTQAPRTTSSRRNYEPEPEPTGGFVASARR